MYYISILGLIVSVLAVPSKWFRFAKHAIRGLHFYIFNTVWALTSRLPAYLWNIFGLESFPMNLDKGLQITRSSMDPNKTWQPRSSLAGKVLWSLFGLFCWASKTRKFSGFRKAVSQFCKWQFRRQTVGTKNSLRTILFVGALFPVLRLNDLQSILLFLPLNHIADSDSRIIQFLSGRLNPCLNIECKHLELRFTQALASWNKLKGLITNLKIDLRSRRSCAVSEADALLMGGGGGGVWPKAKMQIQCMF